MASSPAPANTDAESSGSIADGSAATTDDATSSDEAGGTATPTAEPDESSSGTNAGPGTCEERCELDADCTVEGDAIGLSCVDGRCADEASLPDPCRSDEECVRQLSGWDFGPPCSTGSECADQPAMFCIEVGGEGHCVPGSTPDYTWCSFLNVDEIEVTDIDGQAVTVCIAADALCGQDDLCFLPCQSDDDCWEDDSAPRCNADTGRCECSLYSCEESGAAFHRCLESGECGCGLDTDCLESGRGDICLEDGTCGCRSVDACPPMGLHDHTTVVCAPV